VTKPTKQKDNQTESYQDESYLSSPTTLLDTAYGKQNTKPRKIRITIMQSILVHKTD